MDNLSNNKKTIIICLIIIFIVTAIVIYLKSKENNVQIEEVKIEKYDANSVIPIRMTEKDIVKKYLNDYKNNMVFNIEDAYNMLNEDYRNEKFGSIDKYQEYVDELMTLSTYSMEVDSYNVKYGNGYKLFRIYDENNTEFIIKEKSIMNFEVYLDDATVNIE